MQLGLQQLSGRARGAELAGVARRGQFAGDQLVGLARERSALEQQGIQALLQAAGAPALLLAHLQIEVAFERVFDVDQGLDVRPAQLSPLCGDNVRIGKASAKRSMWRRFFSEKPRPYSASNCLATAETICSP